MELRTMSCTISQGVVFCQTDPLGALAIGTAIVLALTLAYTLGLTGRLNARLARETRARVAETSDEDPRYETDGGSDEE